MSKMCQITGKKRMIGNNVSHANNKNKRLFNVNLFKKKIFVPHLNKWICLKISSSGLKLINKIGVDEAYIRAKKNGFIK